MKKAAKKVAKAKTKAGKKKAKKAAKLAMAKAKQLPATAKGAPAQDKAKPAGPFSWRDLDTDTQSQLECHAFDVLAADISLDPLRCEALDVQLAPADDLAAHCASFEERGVKKNEEASKGGGRRAYLEAIKGAAAAPGGDDTAGGGEMGKSHGSTDALVDAAVDAAEASPGEVLTLAYGDLLGKIRSVACVEIIARVLEKAHPDVDVDRIHLDLRNM